MISSSASFTIICARENNSVRNARPIFVCVMNGSELRSRRIPVRPIRIPMCEVSMSGTTGGMTLDRNVSMLSWIEEGRVGELGG